MINKYKSLNNFERRYFWSCLILTIIGGCFLIFTVQKEINVLQKVFSIAIVSILLFYYNNVIYRSLSRQEKEWKGMLDPIINKDAG